MTSARDKAIEALAELMPIANAAAAFDAMVPALVWGRNNLGDYIAPSPNGDYTVFLRTDGRWTAFLGGVVIGPPSDGPAAAQAAADDHHIAQRLAGTKLWEQMEAMG